MALFLTGKVCIVVQVMPDSVNGRLGSVQNVQLYENIADVALDRLDSDTQPICDFLVVLALGNSLQHLNFPMRQVLPQRFFVVFRN